MKRPDMPFKVGDRVFARVVGKMPNTMPGTIVEVIGATYVVQIDEPPPSWDQPVVVSEELLWPCPFGPEVRPRPFASPG
jgi:hypothetical protein